MDISTTSFRILKYLNSHKVGLFKETDLYRPLGIYDREEILAAFEELQKMDLVGGGKGNVSYKLEGGKYFENIKSDNEDLAHEDVYTDIHYCILKYLYKNNKGVRLDEFPISIQRSVPDAGMYNNGNLHQYLYQQSDFIKETKSNYTLTEQGNREYLRRKTTKDKIPESTPLVLNKIDKSMHFAGDNKGNATTGEGSQESNFSENKVEKKKWFTKIIDEFIKNVVQYIFTVIVGFIIGVTTGKSCNQASNLKQSQQPVQKIVQDTTRK